MRQVTVVNGNFVLMKDGAVVAHATSWALTQEQVLDATNGWEQDGKIPAYMERNEK